MCTAYSAQIYKWADENGRIHYGEQPQGKLVKQWDKTRINTHAKQQDFSGNWYGVIRGRQVVVSLSSMRFRVRSYGRNESSLLANGKLVKQGGALELTWFESNAWPEWMDREDLWYIARLNETNLVLKGPEEWTLHRFVKKQKMNHEMNSILGSWSEQHDTDWKYVFTDSKVKYEYRKKYRWNVIMEGNWSINKGRLEIVWVKVMEKKWYGLQGKKILWQFSMQDLDHIQLKEKKGKTRHFTRQY